MRKLRPLLVALAVAAAFAPAARAGEVIDAAVEALRTDPVYVHPDAERAINDAEADRLRARIASANAGPMYVAILPDATRLEAGGDADEALRAVIDGVARDGTYVIVVGDSLRAADNTLEGVSARELAREAFDEHRREGVAATLLAFVDLAAESQREPEGAGTGAFLVPLLAVGAIGFFLFRRRRRHREETELAEVKAAAQEDLLALADDIRALDLDVEMPGTSTEARDDYARALSAYERADAALDRARRPEELEPVSAAIEEGRFAMASAKARLEGRPPPERRPPCFFDPRHGPSDRDVEWTPPWGAPRLVPACEADAQMVERGLEPQPREVLVGGERTPYWNAPPAYGPYAGGFFGGFGGLFPGLLIGSMLMGPFGGLGGHYGDYGNGGDAGGGDFSDGFGSDFGGGDFGGGDFGGGDFGGGDFGGD